jgi:hypothetical protein
MSAAYGSAVALAGPGSVPPALARYFAALNPITATAAAAATGWARALDEAARHPERAVEAELQQVALGQGQALDDARRAVAGIPVPAGLETLHRSVDQWLRGTIESCEVVYRAGGALDPSTLAEARALIREAGREAGRFNRERSVLVDALTKPPSLPRAGRAPMSSRETRAMVVGMVLALGMAAGVVHATTQIAAMEPPTVVAAPQQGGVPSDKLARIAQLLGVPVASLVGKSEAELLAMAAKAGKRDAVAALLGQAPDRRVYPAAEVLSRLKAEIATRKVLFSNPDVDLVAPDRIVVKGRIKGGASTIPVEVELQMSVTPDKRPRVDAKRLAAVGVEVPVEAFEALTKRVEEANATLPDQVPDGFDLKRLYVENEAVVAEPERAAP